jgi:hypothetical protein
LFSSVMPISIAVIFLAFREFCNIYYIILIIFKVNVTKSQVKTL